MRLEEGQAEPEFSIHKAAGVLIKERKILVEKSVGKDFFIAPGGSVEDDEAVPQALVRELLEEFRIEVNESDLEYLDTFYAEAAGRPGEHLRMDVYMVNYWTGEPTPDHEVDVIEWIASANPKGLQIGSIFEHDVIPLLVEKGLID